MILIKDRHCVHHPRTNIFLWGNMILIKDRHYVVMNRDSLGGTDHGKYDTYKGSTPILPYRLFLISIREI